MLCKFTDVFTKRDQRQDAGLFSRVLEGVLLRVLVRQFWLVGVLVRQYFH